MTTGGVGNRAGRASGEKGCDAARVVGSRGRACGGAGRTSLTGLCEGRERRGRGRLSAESAPAAPGHRRRCRPSGLPAVERNRVRPLGGERHGLLWRCGTNPLVPTKGRTVEVGGGRRGRSGGRRRWYGSAALPGGAGSFHRIIGCAASIATTPEVRLPRSGAGLSCGMNVSNVPTCLDWVLSDRMGFDALRVGGS